MSTVKPTNDPGGSRLNDLGDKAATGVFIPIYLLVEGGKAAGRGLAALLGQELFSLVRSAFRQGGRDAVALGRGAVHVLEVPVEASKVAAGEALGVGKSGVVETAHGVKTVAGGTLKAVEMPLRPLAVLAQEEASYVGPFARRVILDGRGAVRGGIRAGYGASEGVFLTLAELCTYVPPGIYQARDLAQSLASAVMTVVGNGAVRAFLEEEMEAVGSGARQGVKDLGDGATGVATLAEMLAEDIGSLLVEGGSVGGSATREVQNSLVEFPVAAKHAMEPLWAVVRLSVRETLSVWFSAGGQGVKGAVELPGQVERVTYGPRLLIQAGIVEFMSVLLSGGSQTFRDLVSQARGGWNASEIPRERLAAAASEVGSVMGNTALQGARDTRNGLVGAYHLLEVTTKDFGLAILREVFSLMDSQLHEGEKLREYLQEDLPETYTVMARLPVELWYMDQREEIEAAYQRAREAAHARFERVRAIFAG